MDQSQETLTSYRELMIPALERIKRAISGKKNKEISDLCQKAIDTVQTDAEPDGNKYFIIFKHALDTRNTKIVEATLYYLQKLISYGFINGNAPDNITEQQATRGRRLIDAIVESVCECTYERDDNVQLQVIKTILTIVTSFSCEVHDRSLFEAFRSCYHIHITTKNQVNQLTAKATLNQMLHFVFQRMESTCSVAKPEVVEGYMRGLVGTLIDKVCVELQEETEQEWCVVCRKPSDGSGELDPVCSVKCREANQRTLRNIEEAYRNNENKFFNDTLLIFRSICKLSLKDLTNSVPAYTHKSKILSLELLLGVIDNPGPVFQNHEAFLDIIRLNLCESLLKNTVSSEKTIFALSLSIFVTLVNNFKAQLKSEIGVFLEQVFLFILTSENSSYNHKLLVLEVFYRITQNPRTTLELFINYDCDVNSQDLLTRMIEILSKLASSIRTDPGDQFEQHLKLTALETLTNIVMAQANWIEKDMSYSIAEDVGNESSSDCGSVGDQDIFERNKAYKTTLTKGIAKFNYKPTLGIKMLGEFGHLDSESPVSIAQFFKNTEGLDKTVLGDYLGNQKPFNLQVLEEYVQLFSFGSMNLVEALRVFLSGFRLPGEGQKVDMFMLKFAGKYFNDSPENFANADAVYVLSFAVIMLQTDLHNVGVKKKMTLEDFIRINRGVNDGQDFPAQYLEEIYEEVRNNPFTLAEDEKAKARLESVYNPKKRQEIFAKETEIMLQKSQELMRKNTKSQMFWATIQIEHIRTMFEVIWPALLASFSIVLESLEDQRFWQLSLQGFSACVKISARFSMDLELETFISALSKFTHLKVVNQQISVKNIECVKMLLKVAKAEANYLKGSWQHVIQCMSRLDYLHLVSSVIPKEVQHTNEMELANSETLFSYITPEDVNEFFNISSYLDDEAVVDFVTNLIEISKQELWAERPQIFCLQALVSVTEFNMNRIGYVWNRLWRKMKEHFSAAGLHPNNFVAMFAMDSLKQLANKFIQKEELNNYNFQSNFLQPFDTVIKQSKDPQVRDMVISCMCNLVSTIGSKIKSGWQIIYEIILHSSKDPDLVFLAFETNKQAVTRCINTARSRLEDMIQCCLNIISQGTEPIAAESVEHLEICMSHTIDPDIWKAVIPELVKNLYSPFLSVQSKSLNVIFKSLLSQGSQFDTELWKFLYKNALKPVIIDVLSRNDANSGWIRNIWQNFCFKTSDIFAMFYEKIGEENALETLEIMKYCVNMQNENVSRDGQAALRYFIQKVAGKFSAEMLGKAVNCFQQLLSESLPTELCIDLSSHESLPFKQNEVCNKCVLQLSLLDSLREDVIQYAEGLSTEAILSLLETVNASYDFARGFDEDIDQRTSLQQVGFLADMKTLPGMLKQERSSLGCLMQYLFLLKSRQAPIDGQLFNLAKQSLNVFISKENYSDDLGEIQKIECDKYTSSLAPIIAMEVISPLVNCVPLAAQNLSQQLGALVTSKHEIIREALKEVILAVFEQARFSDSNQCF